MNDNRILVKSQYFLILSFFLYQLRVYKTKANVNWFEAKSCQILSDRIIYTLVQIATVIIF
jgi:hypothetical protein